MRRAAKLKMVRTMREAKMALQSPESMSLMTLKMYRDLLADLQEAIDLLEHEAMPK